MGAVSGARARTQTSAPRPGRRAALAASRRRRRRNWIVAGGIGLAVVGLVVGLRMASLGSSPVNGGAGSSASSASPIVGRIAPDGSFTTVSGQTMSVASLRGKPTLLWFVATWCPSCQTGTQALAESFPRLRARGVRVVEIELYQDLGQPGPDMPAFGRSLAGPLYGSPDWTFATSSEPLTRTYDPQDDLDIYYLLDAQGKVTYVNSSPESTMDQLLAHTEGIK
jgi:thiol-disulfide isomerase/thioredoxin